MIYRICGVLTSIALTLILIYAWVEIGPPGGFIATVCCIVAHVITAGVYGVTYVAFKEKI